MVDNDKILQVRKRGMFGLLYKSILEGNTRDATLGLMNNVDMVKRLYNEWGFSIINDINRNIIINSGVFNVLYGDGSECDIGSYEKHISTNVILKECLIEKTLTISNSVLIPKDCPKRLGLVPRNDTIYNICSNYISMPNISELIALAEVSYGYGWSMFDNTITCIDCINCVGIGFIYGTFYDYFHFSDCMISLKEHLSEKYCKYIEHCLIKHDNNIIIKRVMDAVSLANQCVFLDVIHKKANKLLFCDNELDEIQYRLINSGVRGITLLSMTEENTIYNDNYIDAVSILTFCVHDASDRRHDAVSYESHNLFNIVSAYNTIDSAFILGRFCTDILSHAIDNKIKWPILICGRFLLWQVFTLRYQTATLLDNLKRNIPNNIEDLYCDNVLNSMNPYFNIKVSYNINNMFCIRTRCNNKELYDNLLNLSIKHIETCNSCNNYDKVNWNERTNKQINEAYIKKHNGNCDCINMLAIYSCLKLVEQFWFAASITSTYIGQTGEFDPYLC